MKINIYDLTGNEHFAQTEDDGLDDIKLFKVRKMRTLLIHPRDSESNLEPYLQSSKNPRLDDFRVDNTFDFSNSTFLSEMLHGSLSKEQVYDLHSFFRYGNGLRSSFSDCNYNILLVPDHYDAAKQEKLLRCCELPRNCTFLLWRSVAICLGAEKELQKLNVREGARVAIVDPQSDGTFDISILTMRKDGPALVPARSSFQKKKNYPVQNKKMESHSKNQNIFEENFWKHTWQKNGEFWVPTETGTWNIRTFSEPDYTCNIPSLLEFVDFYIISGNANLKFAQAIPAEKIIREHNQSLFALTGGGRFAVRNHYNRPTYFDECESLYFVVQDVMEEKILSRELIHGGEFCKGGKIIEGKTNKEFFLEKDKDRVDFRIYTGVESEKANLKKLTHIFGVTTEKNQPLTLYPSMIPGQGIAKVLVEAHPLIPEMVELDFLQMEDDIYIEETDTLKQRGRETIEHLQTTLPRSFPVDFPEVEASRSLYDEYDVMRYLEKHHSIDGGLFAKSQYPNSKASGIERFKRINVFGTQKGKEFPFNDPPFFDRLFKRIAADYHRTKNVEYVRLAAWTYKCGQKYFRDIIQETLNKIEHKAQGRKTSVLKQEFTVCSNMLSEEEQIFFIRKFIQYAKSVVADAKSCHTVLKGVDEWIRALKGILIYSNSCLQRLSTKECEQCSAILFDILHSYVHNNKDQQYIIPVLCCLLFILRRRKYDRSFMKEETTDLYKRLCDFCTAKIAKVDLFNPADAMYDVLLKYLKGKGSLDIPMGVF